MTSKTLKLSILAITIYTVAFVNAQERQRQHRTNPEAVFQKLDTNKDGAITLDEFKKRPSRKEIQEEMVETHFKTLDLNTDGSLSLNEFKKGKDMAKKERLKKHFSSLDKDDNGVIDFDEFEAFNETKRHKRKHKRSKD
ncbi:EF-hand domain-containing protein [Winogradskyella aquimaris]|uniref:EF-hand domain-containing protein n=1 Tax=Winogradskyella aquimaris TaxID=864074 RepID=A0ABU5EPA6_9FLAO|nr:EF-hand domain-containing protein [Winogradskyella aquimaris]MDY2587891.1 EF-hand domain-containing protein [Winogradskyella aquimaris]